LGHPLAGLDKMGWPLMGWWPNQRNKGGGACAGDWAAALPIVGELGARPGRERGARVRLEGGGPDMGVVGRSSSPE
jgi:hypothetical protein